MSNADYYAPGTYNDPNAPWNQEDIEDTEVFWDAKMDLWKERINDAPGYMLESLSERDTADLKQLSTLIMGNVNGTHTEAIGGLVTKWVWDYCEPEDWEVIESMDKDGGY